MSGVVAAVCNTESATPPRPAPDARTRAAAIRRKYWPWTLRTGLGGIVVALLPLPTPMALTVAGVLFLVTTGLGIVAAVQIAALMHLVDD